MTGFPFRSHCLNVIYRQQLLNIGPLLPHLGTLTHTLHTHRSIGQSIRMVFFFFLIFVDISFVFSFFSCLSFSLYSFSLLFFFLLSFLGTQYTLVLGIPQNVTKNINADLCDFWDWEFFSNLNASNPINVPFE